MLTLAVIVIVSGALIAGAAWGIYGSLPQDVEGFIVALAGGALLVSATIELIEPSIKAVSVWAAMAAVVAGAVAFSALAHAVKERWGSDSGGGLLAAITLDGVPENLALGVALIGAGPREVAALAGSILLSNLPEAAGGADAMARNERSRGSAMALWTATAVLLSGAALAGNLLFAGASPAVLGLIRCFASGAVVASLGTEVFPKAFKEEGYGVGVATALGVVLAVLLSQLG